MKRRSFVKSSLLTSSMSGLTAIAIASETSASAAKTLPPEYYELRTYSFNKPAQANLVMDYWEKAAIPALNRIGYHHIGVFSELKPSAIPKLFVLIPFPNVGAFAAVEAKLAADKTYLAAAASYLEAPATEPAYDRIESSLLAGFAKHPVLVAPEKKSRIFELRRYESASEAAGKKKIKMFNDVGEIDIFKRTGLQPVFFGETIIGELRPNLTYMLVFDNMEAHDLHWKIFAVDPEWVRIKSIPEYADAKIVSHITSTFLVPTEFSQV